MHKSSHFSYDFLYDILISSFPRFAEETGKYYNDLVESKSSEETLSEENQKKLFDMSAAYVGLEGFEKVEVVRPVEVVEVCFIDILLSLIIIHNNIIQ